MALKCNFSYKGLQVTEGIAKVIKFEGRKSDVLFVVGYYSDTDSGLLFCSEHQLEYNLSGENVMEQCYIYLKALPEFSGAIDVLEDGQFFHEHNL